MSDVGARVVDVCRVINRAFRPRTRRVAAALVLEEIIFGKMIAGFSRGLLLGLLALLFAGCGGSNQSAASKKSAYLETLRADWSSYSMALSKVSAACPVPTPTLKTMHRCKLRTLALIKVNETVIDDLGNNDPPTKLQKPLGALARSLADLDDAMTTVIRRYIDRNDVAGFQTSGGPGSPIDNGIEGANAAVADIDRLEPDAKLSPTVFVPPS